MNRIENIILALATAAAFLIASTTHADPAPCPNTGVHSTTSATAD